MRIHFFIKIKEKIILKIVELLPMKGNSKRVPNTNLKEFGGKPLYHRVINS